MSWFQRVLPPSTVCSYLEGSEFYQQQRDRAAALAHKGFAVWDGYQKARPYLFASGLLLAAAGGALWYQRGFRRAKKGNARIAEAHVIYPALAAAGLAVAYVTRPDNLLPSREPRVTESSGAGFTGWLDEEVEKLRRQDRQFADKVAERIIKAPGVRTIWAHTPDHARAFVQCGRR